MKKIKYKFCFQGKAYRKGGTHRFSILILQYFSSPGNLIIFSKYFDKVLMHSFAWNKYKTNNFVYTYACTHQQQITLYRNEVLGIGNMKWHWMRNGNTVFYCRKKVGSKGAVGFIILKKIKSSIWTCEHSTCCSVIMACFKSKIRHNTVVLSLNLHLRAQQKMYSMLK